MIRKRRAPAAGEAPSVLVVEDEELVAVNLAARLAEFGYRVTATARTGAEALESARLDPPDLALMDVSLEDGPGGPMDGVETARRLREGFGVPVIYLTAYSGREVLERAKLTLPLGYLVKPFQPAELFAAIEMAWARLQAERAAPGNPPRNPPSHPHPHPPPPRPPARVEGPAAALLPLLPRLLYVVSESPYSRPVLEKPSPQQPEILVSLSQIEAAFPGLFVRAHRSHLALASRVLCANVRPNATYELWLRNRDGVAPLPVGRAHLAALKAEHPEWFGER